MKTFLLLLTLALVSLAPSTATAAPVKAGEHWQYLSYNAEHYAYNYVLLGYWWEWWGYPVFVTSWRATSHNHEWGVRQLVEDWYDDETFEEWQVYLNPENFERLDEYLILWLEYDPPPGGGGDEEAIASPVAEEF